MQHAAMSQLAEASLAIAEALTDFEPESRDVRKIVRFFTTPEATLSTRGPGASLEEALNKASGAVAAHGRSYCL